MALPILAGLASGAVHLDREFNVELDGLVRTVQLQPDGKILIGGAFTHVNGLERIGIARLWPNGSLDETFVPDPTGVVARLLVSNLKIYAAVEHANVPPFLNEAGIDIRAYGVDGDLKHIYAGYIWPWYPGFTVDPQGRLLYGQTRGFRGQGALQRYNEDGSYSRLQVAIGCCGSDGVYAVAAQNDGGTPKILIGGQFFSIGTNFQPNFARLNDDGTFDTTFRGSAPEPVNDIQFTADGKIYASAGHQVSRHLPDGSIDQSFATILGGFGILFYFLAPLEDGGVIVIGSSCGAICETVVWRFDAAGTRDTNFLIRVDEPARSLAIQRDGGIIIGGGFTNVNCIRRPYLARLIPSDTPDPIPCIPIPPKPEPELTKSRVRWGRVTLCWPADYPEYVLQGTRHLNKRHPERTRWLTVTNIPACDDLNCCVTNKVLRWGRNYRLVKTTAE